MSLALEFYRVVILLDVAVVVEVLALFLQIRPDDPSNIPSLSAFDVSHVPQSVCAKDDAPWNIMFMAVTPDTSHLEMSRLNEDAEANIPIISVTLDTSH